MAKQLYEPEIIQETPFPDEVIQPFFSSGSSDNKADVSPDVIKENFPRKRTAVELLSTTLNTRSRKILQEFKLEELGGIKIGDFKKGISGDIRHTPNGITARDKAGITTFAIDGTDGSAVFKGEIRAGSLVSGEVSVIGGSFIVKTSNGTPVAIMGVF